MENNNISPNSANQIQNNSENNQVSSDNLDINNLFAVDNINDNINELSESLNRSTEYYCGNINEVIENLITTTDNNIDLITDVYENLINPIMTPGENTNVSENAMNPNDNASDTVDDTGDDINIETVNDGENNNNNNDNVIYNTNTESQNENVSLNDNEQNNEDNSSNFVYSTDNIINRIDDNQEGNLQTINASNLFPVYHHYSGVLVSYDLSDSETENEDEFMESNEVSQQQTEKAFTGTFKDIAEYNSISRTNARDERNDESQPSTSQMETNVGNNNSNEIMDKNFDERLSPNFQLPPQVKEDLVNRNYNYLNYYKKTQPKAFKNFNLKDFPRRFPQWDNQRPGPIREDIFWVDSVYQKRLTVQLTKGKKNQRYAVRWLGYPDRDITLEPRSALIEDIVIDNEAQKRGSVSPQGYNLRAKIPKIESPNVKITTKFIESKFTEVEDTFKKFQGKIESRFPDIIVPEIRKFGIYAPDQEKAIEATFELIGELRKVIPQAKGFRLANCIIGSVWGKHTKRRRNGYKVITKKVTLDVEINKELNLTQESDSGRKVCMFLIIKSNEINQQSRQVEVKGKTKTLHDYKLHMLIFTVEQYRNGKEFSRFYYYWDNNYPLFGEIKAYHLIQKHLFPLNKINGHKIFWECNGAINSFDCLYQSIIKICKVIDGSEFFGKDKSFQCVRSNEP